MISRENTFIMDLNKYTRGTVFFVSLYLVCRAQSNDVGYRLLPSNSEARFCDSDVDCDGDKGEVCWWFYDGCSRGQCMCHPRTHHWGPSNRCEPVRLGGDHCSLDSDCPETMSCQYGVCECQAGYLAPDATICLLSHHRLLGQECQQSDDTCVQRAEYGYTTHEVECSMRGECVCTDGYKRDGYSCRKWSIHEEGCQDSYQCQGGAVCLDSQCVCPVGYTSVADNTMCAKKGAITGVKIGAHCDELNEQRYCATGLVCHQCGGERDLKCVRFLKTELRPPTASRVTSGSDHSVSLLSRIYLLVIVWLLCNSSR